MLKSRTIKDAMMLIIYLTGQRLQVDWGAALTGAGLPQLALPSAHLHPQRMRPKPETGQKLHHTMLPITLEAPKVAGPPRLWQLEPRKIG